MRSCVHHSVWPVYIFFVAQPMCGPLPVPYRMARLHVHMHLMFRGVAQLWCLMPPWLYCLVWHVCMFMHIYWWIYLIHTILMARLHMHLMFRGVAQPWCLVLVHACMAITVPFPSLVWHVCIIASRNIVSGMSAMLSIWIGLVCRWLSSPHTVLLRCLVSYRMARLHFTCSSCVA